MPRYLLVLRKTSFFLKPRSSTISLESSRVCSSTEATWHPTPLNWCVIHQGLTAKHGCWEPSLGFWGLNICPFCSSAGGVADFLLLHSSLSLFFPGWTRSSSLHYVFALLLPPPFRVSLFNPRRQGWLRSTRRGLRRRRWKLGLSRLPRPPFSWLVLYQFQQAFLGFSLNAHLFW